MYAPSGSKLHFHYYLKLFITISNSKHKASTLNKYLVVFNVKQKLCEFADYSDRQDYKQKRNSMILKFERMQTLMQMYQNML